MIGRMGALATALAAAQAELRDPDRTRTGSVRGRSDHKYAGLDDLLQAVRPVLARHGLALSQTLDTLDGRVVLCTRLCHASGTSLTSHYPLDWEGGPQERGSELTYARRHSLEAIIGVSATTEEARVRNHVEPPAARPVAPMPPDAPLGVEPPAPGPSPDVIEALVAADWERETVVADVRDFFCWLGAGSDPWSLEHERQHALPGFLAERDEEHELWLQWRQELTTLLSKRGLAFDDLAEWCRAHDFPVPDTLDRAAREAFLVSLRKRGAMTRIVEHRKAARQAA